MSAARPAARPAWIAENTPPRYPPCTSKPTTAICTHCIGVDGQGARKASVIGSIRATTSAKRNNRKVIGPACRRPAFAAMNPVLQKNTNRSGVARIQNPGADALAFTGRIPKGDRRVPLKCLISMH